jgi:hypothetical protein
MLAERPAPQLRQRQRWLAWTKGIAPGFLEAKAPAELVDVEKRGGALLD